MIRLSLIRQAKLKANTSKVRKEIIFCFNGGVIHASEALFSLLIEN